MKYRLIRWMRNFILTRWAWNMWIHKKWKIVAILPFWENPGTDYRKVDWKE